jgi:hypothetical protein
MPHYKDGTEAKVGDHVIGRPYNTDHDIAGTVVSISPAADSCNLQVEFVESLPLGATHDHGTGQVCLPHHAFSAYAARAKNAVDDGRVCATADQSTKGAPHKRHVCRDYGAVKDFTLVARPDHVK